MLKYMQAKCSFGKNRVHMKFKLMQKSIYFHTIYCRIHVKSSFWTFRFLLSR